MAIEVEKRGLLTEAAYSDLPAAILALGGEDAGENDTESIFYATDTAQLKLQIRHSQKKAKIAWKSGGFDGASSRQEIEVGIDFHDVKPAEALLDKLAGGALKVPTAQKRHDFVLEGVNIAVKYSDHWQYHVEFDTVVESDRAVEQALSDIQRVADMLHVQLLSADEEKTFVESIVARL